MSSTAKQRTRSVIVHGHFYQPPRENPFTGQIDRQDSAGKFHDWNARINRECYAPNARARLMGNGSIRWMMNNYAYMSFNFGATLLSWMAQHAPDVLRAIVEGDRQSQVRCGGHGNALAQVYNHVIMPLASARDKRTQVLWGIADFRARFGREPEGMWLAETAADTASLEAMAAEGIKFTVLAPRQAWRSKPIGYEHWHYDGIDPSRAYQCTLPSGKKIALFFYDGPISQGVAFEKLLDSGEKFYHRLMSGFSDSRVHDQLVHIATDGESYGHHHMGGEMCLAWALDAVRNTPGIKLTNYGEFLENHPPEWEVEIHDGSSWSCAHGVERWRSDCGCKTRHEWGQSWRGPLRGAFDHLKSKLDQLFELEGKKYFKNAWAARDAYVDVLLQGDCHVAEFMGTHAKRGLTIGETRRAINLLEMQRNAMLMYTSCGWFFDELSGIETTQDMMYAARAMQIARLFGWDLEEEFLRILEKAPSNLYKYGNGRGVWSQCIRPTAVVQELECVFDEFDTECNIQALVTRVMQLLDQAVRIPLELDMWEIENRVLDTYSRLAGAGMNQGSLKTHFRPLIDKLRIEPQLLGWNEAGSLTGKMSVGSTHHCPACGECSTHRHDGRKTYPWNK